MSPFDVDSDLHPVAEARPLIEAFVRSPRCSPRHRPHARTTLELLVLFVAMTTERGPEGLPWESLNPDLLLSAALEVDPSDRRFVDDLLGVSAELYEFLGETGLVEASGAIGIAARLRWLGSEMGVAA